MRLPASEKLEIIRLVDNCICRRDDAANARHQAIDVLSLV